MMILKTFLESKDGMIMAESTGLRTHKMKRAPDRSSEAQASMNRGMYHSYH